MNKTLKSALRYAIEIVIVAFGVFLGVYYSNLNAAEKTDKEKEKSISLIVQELENNQRLLLKDIEYHEGIKEALDSIFPSLSEEDLYTNFLQSSFKHEAIDGWKGFVYSRLQQTAFESAKTTGIIREFDLELVQKLSNIYHFQNTYIGFGESILDKAFQTNSDTKVVDFIGIIQLMTSDLLSAEKQLVMELERTLKDLNNGHPTTKTSD